MRLSSAFWLSLSALIACGLTVQPIPSLDEWFRPPTGWQDTAPGAVLKVRESAYSPIPVRNCLDTFQVLYRTTDTHSNASWAVTTVFIPSSHADCATDPKTCSHALVTYQVPYDTPNPESAASYLLQFGEPYGDIGLSLGRGWFVSVPDYEGPLASFTSGIQAGYATLDAVRAVQKAAQAYGLRNDTLSAIWGYSGGGQATGFAAEMAPKYAPELELAGAVIGGPPPNISSAFPYLNRGKTSGLIVASLLGITAQWPDARQALLRSVNTSGPYNISGFLTPYYVGGLRSLYLFWGQDIFQYFPNGQADTWTPTMRAIYNREAVMGSIGVPRMPVFLYRALNDEFSPGHESDQLVEKYCAGGANILYHRNTVGLHNSELTNGRQRALYFLAAVLDGNRTTMEIPETGCLTADVTENLDPENIA